MGFDFEHVEDIFQEKNFDIISLDNTENPDIVRMTVVHDLHPEAEVIIEIISKKEVNENGEEEEVMEMQFTGPDEYTDEEAKQVLEEVMKTFVEIIEKAIPEEPKIPESNEESNEEENED